MDRQGAQGRVGIAAVALGVTVALEAWAPAVWTQVLPSYRALGFLIFGVLGLLAFGLPTWISYSLWRLTRPERPARLFRAALVCYLGSFASLVLLVLGGWAWALLRHDLAPQGNAALVTATSGVPAVLSLAAMFLLALGVERTLSTSRWIAWIGIATVGILAALVLPSAYSLYAMTLSPVEPAYFPPGWVDWLSDVGRALAAVFWIALGFLLWQGPGMLTRPRQNGQECETDGVVEQMHVQTPRALS